MKTRYTIVLLAVTLAFGLFAGSWFKERKMLKRVESIEALADSSSFQLLSLINEIHPEEISEFLDGQERMLKLVEENVKTEYLKETRLALYTYSSLRFGEIAAAREALEMTIFRFHEWYSLQHFEPSETNLAMKEMYQVIQADEELMKMIKKQRAAIGIGLPIAEEPSHTTTHTDP